MTKTQSVGQTDSGLSSIEKAAKVNADLQFNNLYSHLSLCLLWGAYFNLKKQAANGVDGISWEEYGKDLRPQVKILHQKLHTKQYKLQASNVYGFRNQTASNDH